MKRNVQKVALMGVAAMLVLGGCGSNNDEKDAQPSDMELASKTRIDGYNVYIIEHKGEDEKCKYILTTGSGTSITPLLGSDHKIVCDKKE